MHCRDEFDLSISSPKVLLPFSTKYFDTKQVICGSSEGGAQLRYSHSGLTSIHIMFGLMIDAYDLSQK